MYQAIQTCCEKLSHEFGGIPPGRKALLETLSRYITEKRKKNESVNLVYICTHNSRRSHFGQVWAAVAAARYKIANVHAFSGGTEATAFNVNAINALKRAGFKIETRDQNNNPVYKVYYSEQENPVECFSKTYDHPANPARKFAAIMTCGEADENCPLIPGSELRVVTTYEDPKAYDSTHLRDSKYDERCRQIALETLYAFSKVK
jgi:arsenate reductase (thioredoxin)